jgi:hypothetical protein
MKSLSVLPANRPVPSRSSDLAFHLFLGRARIGSRRAAGECLAMYLRTLEDGYVSVKVSLFFLDQGINGRIKRKRAILMSTEEMGL